MARLCTIDELPGRQMLQTIQMSAWGTGGETRNCHKLKDASQMGLSSTLAHLGSQNLAGYKHAGNQSLDAIAEKDCFLCQPCQLPCVQSSGPGSPHCLLSKDPRH